MHMVLLNGPAGAGKNTFADKLRTELFPRMRKAGVKSVAADGVYRVAVLEYKQPMIDMLFAFAESLSLIEIGANRADTDLYRLLKDADMLGVKGRQHMIDWSEAMKKRTPNIWVDFLIQKARNMQCDVVIVADCGFENEVEIPRRKLGATNVDFIYFDGWQANPKRYTHGQNFDNDSRFCLRNYTAMSDIADDPKPEDAADAIVLSLTGRQLQASML